MRYIGPEIMRREGTKEDDEWPPQSKKRKVEVLDIDEIRLRTTVKDSRSIIKLYPIEQDFDEELKKVCLWFDELRNSPEVESQHETPMLPGN